MVEMFALIKWSHVWHLQKHLQLKVINSETWSLFPPQVHFGIEVDLTWGLTIGQS